MHFLDSGDPLPTTPISVSRQGRAIKPSGHLRESLNMIVKEAQKPTISPLTMVTHSRGSVMIGRRRRADGGLQATRGSRALRAYWQRIAGGSI